jgi:hypothetical protein
MAEKMTKRQAMIDTNHYRINLGFSSGQKVGASE